MTAFTVLVWIVIYIVIPYFLGYQYGLSSPLLVVGITILWCYLGRYVINFLKEGK